MSNYRQTISASTLEGDTICDRQGNKIGTVKEVMLDILSGQIAYVVVSFGGILSLGEKVFAVPYQLLEVDEAKKALVTSLDEETLTKAPSFPKDNWPDWNALDLESIYSAYNIAPYWV